MVTIPSLNSRLNIYKFALKFNLRLKNRVVVFIAILLLLTGAILVFLNVDKLNLNKKTGIRELVPQNAVIVYESPDLINKWNDFMNTSMWSNLETLENYQEIKSTLEDLDELTGSTGVLDQLTKTGGFLVSTHIISNEKFDHVFLVDMRKQENQDFFFKKLRTGLEDNSYIQSQREYNNQSIYELSKSKSENPFISYIIIDNILAISQTPYLVEDVIRTYQRDTESFFQAFPGLNKVTKLNYDAGNLYMNLKEFTRYIRLFFDNSKEEFLFPLEGLSGYAFSDVDFNNNYTFLNGLIYPEQENQFLKIFDGQESQGMDFVSMVPDRTASFFYFKFDQTERFYNNLWEYYSVRDPEITKSYSEFKNDFGSFEDRFLSWLSNTVALLQLESLDPQQKQKVLILESNDINESLNHFSNIATRVNEQTDDTLYFEDYGGKVISLIEIPEFPSRILGKGFEGFESSFYTAIDKYIIISNEIESLKTLIDDIENDQTWGKSISKNEFLDLTLENSNVGVILNMPRMWNNFSEKLSPFWAKTLKEKRNNFLHFDLWSAQFNVLDNTYYTNIIIKHKEFLGGSRASQSSEMAVICDLELESPVKRKPKVVRNHTNGSLEMFVQDSLNNIYLLDRNCRVLWKDSLNKPIDSEIFQVDFFANKKLQYLFLSDNKLYLIDRNGVNVDGFPILIQDIRPIGMNVVDYNNSKNYRYFFNESNGNVWLTDKNVGPLRGWAPNNFSMGLERTPFHVRIRGKDVFIILGKNGQLLITNRRGEYLGSFPIDLDARISGDVFIESKSTFKESLLYMLSEEGELITVSFEGDIKERKQLFRPSKDSRFKLIKERLGKTFVISRQDYNTLTILDRSGQSIFEKDYFSNEEFETQYYNYGSSNALYAVRVPSERKVYLYNESGKLISFPALTCDFPVSVIYHENQSDYVIYGSSGKNIFTVRIKQ